MAAILGRSVTLFIENGSATFHGSGIFTGVVNGQSGTMVMIYEGTANAQGVASANWVLEQGTGGLTNLHGQGTFEGTLVALQTSPCTPSPGGEKLNRPSFEVTGVQ